VLRLWGLSDRVLIIDEAHAYDTYMSRELESLLEFQAALGGSAIVLSATLPRRQQTALAQSFARGLGVIAEDPISNGYPLLTCVSCTGSTSEHLASRQDRERALPVRRLTNEKMAIDHVVEMARQDCAVAWIRNAVDDAIEAATALTQQGLTPVLLHTRFAMGDRLDIEQRVRAALGLDDKIGVRRGFVVVGTQILEQSLDYDVDAMVTDLAPIDLVIQRAGRLWRHSDRRPRPVERPELCIVSPDPEQVDNADWYRSMSARAAAVYAHHGIIWRSAKTLFDTGLIVTPDGVRGLIDCVYAIDGLDDIPEPLRRASQNAHGKEGAARSFANANLLKVDQGYGGCQELWLADTITPTRLGEPVTVFRMGRVSNGAIMPWYPDGSLARAWALSEVSLSRRRADGVPTSDPAREKLMAQVKTSWPKWEHDIPLLVLEPDGDMWRADVKLGATIVPVVYDTKTGLRFSA
jgi:CRISPR-associated endonuclease/helicase Cas3